MSTQIHPESNVTFGPKLTFSSSKNVDFSVTDDNKGFEVRFRTALAAGVGTPSFNGLKATLAPIGTNVYSAMVPATGKNAEMAIVVNGFGQTEPGASVSVVVVANGQHSASHFAKLDEAFTASLVFRAKRLSDVRVTVLIVAERDAGHPGASALIAITDISADSAQARN